MGGLVSRENRYDGSFSSEVEELAPVAGPTTNGRRRSRKLSLRFDSMGKEVERVRSSHLAVPCGNRHPFADYRFNKKLGAGAFSVVYKGTSVYNENATVAIKEVRTSELTKDQAQDLQTEMNILSQLQHKNIVKLTAVFVVPEKIFLIMEYLRGGELLKAICKRNHYEERDAKRIMIQIVDAIRYIHNRDVVHRDLKPENIILETRDFHSSIKIVDFGFAVVMEDFPTKGTKYVKGTPGYMAPEVLTQGACSPAVDIWSLGVILYILLSGSMPFSAKNKESVINVEYQFPEKLWKTVSAPAVSLIRSMLVKDPLARPSADDVMRHPWLTSYYEEEVGASNKSDQGAAVGDQQPAVVAPVPSLSPSSTHRHNVFSADAVNGGSSDGKSLGPLVSDNSSPVVTAGVPTFRQRSPSTLLHPIAEFTGEYDVENRGSDVSSAHPSARKSISGEVHDGDAAVKPLSPRPQLPTSASSQPSECKENMPVAELREGDLSVALAHLQAMMGIRVLGHVVRGSIRFQQAGERLRARRQSSPGLSKSMLLGVSESNHAAAGDKAGSEGAAGSAPGPSELKPRGARFSLASVDSASIRAIALKHSDMCTAQEPGAASSAEVSGTTSIDRMSGCGTPTPVSSCDAHGGRGRATEGCGDGCDSEQESVRGNWSEYED